MTGVVPERLIRGGRRSRLRSIPAVLAAAYLALAAICAIFASAIAPYPAAFPSLLDRFTHPWSRGPGGQLHLLGADALGRDVLSRLIAGARTSLALALLVVAISVVVGGTLGLLAATIGRRTEAVIMRLVDAQVAFPGLLFAILIVSVTGGSFWALVGVLSFHGWMIFTRLVRGQVAKTRQLLYVQAADLIGIRRMRILVRHILPTTALPVITQCLLEAARVILAESSLSYLGLGIQPPGVSWGVMIAENQDYLATAWWTVLFPGLAIALTIISLYTISAWLTSRFDVGAADAVQAIPARTGRPLAVSARQDIADAGEAPAAAPLLEIRKLTVTYPAPADASWPAVRDVSLTIHPGEVLAVVGESGSGKTTLGLSISALLPAEAVITGEYLWRGARLSAADRTNLRGSSVGVVFQDPTRRLNPIIPAGIQIAESLRRYKGMGRAQARSATLDLLEQVGIRNPRTAARALPFQLSGGMAQRVLIAACMGMQPDLIVADEPTASLDVRTQEQILDLLRGLSSAGTAILLVSHDLGVVSELADTVMVMYAGRVAETARSNDLFLNARHPYTAGLIASIPLVSVAGQQLRAIPGSPGSARHISAGCPFSPRCDRATERCLAEMPPLEVPSAQVAVSAAGSGDALASEPGAALVACWNPL